MNTVAIIGHGRSPEGKGWGKRIDQCTVIRMWDWHWQDPTDYGARYDYGFFEVYPSMIGDFNAYRQTEPMEGWIGSVLGHPERCNLPKRTTLVYQKPWNEIGKAMGGVGATGNLQFTRGTIAACWAIENIARDGEIVLVGFDNVALGRTLPISEAFSKVYRKQPSTFPFNSYQENATKHGNHDFAIERPVMEHLAEENGVLLGFAQEIW